MLEIGKCSYFFCLMTVQLAADRFDCATGQMGQQKATAHYKLNRRSGPVGAQVDTDHDSSFLITGLGAESKYFIDACFNSWDIVGNLY